MKTIILSFVLSMISYFGVSQETYAVDDTSYPLIKETNGTIVLLWHVIKGKDRYFIKTNNTLIELINSKNENGRRNYEYKSVLADLTSDENISVEKVKLKLMSLKRFIDTYNTLKDPAYIANSKGKILTRFIVFGGISNSPFLDNLDNIKTPILGIEFEFSEFRALPRHSLYFQGRQVFNSDGFDYSATQFIIGYRYRIINKKALTFYASLDLARYAFVKAKTTEPKAPNNEPMEIKENGFDAPLIFNLGTDIRLSDFSFLTLNYNELFSIFLGEQTNFPVSFSVGYKINL